MKKHMQLEHKATTTPDAVFKVPHKQIDGKQRNIMALLAKSVPKDKLIQKSIQKSIHNQSANIWGSATDGSVPGKSEYHNATPCKDAATQLEDLNKESCDVSDTVL